MRRLTSANFRVFFALPMAVPKVSATVARLATSIDSGFDDVDRLCLIQLPNRNSEDARSAACAERIAYSDGTFGGAYKTRRGALSSTPRQPFTFVLCVLDKSRRRAAETPVATMSGNDRVYLSYEGIHDSIRKQVMAEGVLDHFKPSMIIAIGTGGFIPAR